MPNIQPAVVAGAFYPADPVELRKMISDFFSQTKKSSTVPKAIISPHAGYVYSGLIAASAYASLQNSNGIKKVVVFAPSHRYPFEGLAVSHAEYFQTPLGNIALDRETIKQIPNVNIINEAFYQEHSLEVQLPFLQVVLKTFKLIPILVGLTQVETIVKVMENIWDGLETLIVISSDLSHYHDYETAQQLDQETANRILQCQPVSLELACGGLGINGLLQVAKKKKLKPKLIDLRNSGDTQGPKDQVVGYGAFNFI